MLPLECCTGLLLACREGVFSWQCGSAMAMRQREGKTQWQVPTNPPHCACYLRFFSFLQPRTCCANEELPAYRDGWMRCAQVRPKSPTYAQRCTGMCLLFCPPSLTSARTTSSLNKCSR
ncbi:hypothetical protein B0H10DRAFT_2083964, partial [Mycena sp. CBHHK59/15]